MKLCLNKTLIFVKIIPALKRMDGNLVIESYELKKQYEMKSTKTSNQRFSIVAMLVFLFVAVSLQAQNRRGSGFHGQLPDSAGVVAHVERLAVDLDLDDGQKAKLLETEQAHFTQVRARREEIQATRGSYRAEMQDLHDEHVAELKKILTEEQFKKWEETHQQRIRERRHDGSGRGYGRGHGRN